MHYHLIGISGIGMSALAKLLLEKGFSVSGSDIKENEETKVLRSLGAKITIRHNEDTIKPGMVVAFSTAIPSHNVEMLAAKKINLPIYHRSILLQKLLEDKKSLCVAGAHGKTSTSALLASIFQMHDQGVSFSIGGVIRHLNTNSCFGNGEVAILEADESDGSFLNTNPDSAIITNTDPDHLYFWKTESSLKAAYKAFAAKVICKENLFLCDEDPFLNRMDKKATRYGFSKKACARILDFGQEEEFSTFTLALDGAIYKDFSIMQLGRHQVLNAAAAISLSLRYGVSEDAIRDALLVYKGVSRRLECLSTKPGTIIYDDYAHHPKEVFETLRALKKAHPKRRIVCVFQPHRYTRLKEHFTEFSYAFSHASYCIVTKVFAAGEKEIEKVNENTLADQIKGPVTIATEDIETSLNNVLKKEDLLVFLGAGDISKTARAFAKNWEAS
ncbi:UDP-N-acetylmuramate--L-alanine ligase [Candidatus Aerophobetes bacterium]|uniref:UDP-N-acetylmuramate--L-alanine ligase n=1 Tax=Aerophobetes bacterium TaxID=2030807 RepID=A0A2A4YI66_UNCAE|nr:MAG: UDP-N-acetylmuramate--L-alanine ligase [Candidatus Aerophobetes bacterium]